MNKRNRVRAAMGRRAYATASANPDASEGYVIALTHLGALLGTVDQAEASQRAGLVQVRKATVRKEELITMMRQAHVAHISGVVQVAADAAPGLKEDIRYKPSGKNLRGVRTALGGMAAAAEANKDVLVKYGLAQSVLDSLRSCLQEFDAWVARGDEGRRLHVTATAELVAATDDIVRVVRVLDGFNRLRFANDPEQLAAWKSATSLAPETSKPASQSEEPPTSGGEVKPAA
jgi:hypothetical protein